MILPVVYTSFMFLFVPTWTFPAKIVSDYRASNFQKNLEIIDGPREFLVPLVPLKSILPHNAATESSEGTDLDYMVYGKLYLTKALNVADRSAELRRDHIENPTFRASTPQTLHANPDVQLSNNDGIAFPDTSKSNKRPYRYKFQSVLQPSNEDLTIHNQRGNAEHRKMEERSADQMPENVATTDNTFVKNDKGETNDPVSLDEEAVELLQTLKPTHIAEVSEHNNNETTTDDEIQGSIHTSSMSADNIDIGDRFLINVPTKPNFTQCPQGEKRTHRGICKPIFVPKPSPNDGFFAGRIIASNVAQRKEQSNAEKTSVRKDETPNLQLSSLLRSVVQLEKRLEKAIKETERQLNAMAQVGVNSSTATTITVDESETKQASN